MFRGAVLRSLATDFLSRDSASTPWPVSHFFICATEFGFSSPVFSCRDAVSFARLKASKRMAFLATSMSSAIPRSFIYRSILY